MTGIPETLTATRLRQIADWVDTHDRLGESYLSLLDQLDKRGVSTGSTETDRLVARDVLSGTGVQDELRGWADWLDAQPAPGETLHGDFTRRDGTRTDTYTLPAADAQPADPQPAPDVEITLREAVEHALVIADGAVAVTDERPSDEWHAAFVANLPAADAQPADPQPALAVPEDMTAEKLRGIANHRSYIYLADSELLLAWADALDAGRLPAVSGRVTPTREDAETIAWQFNEAVSLLREARRNGWSPSFADEVDEGLPAIQVALELAALVAAGYLEVTE